MAMHIEGEIFPGFRILLLVAFAALMSSCHGQDSRNDIRSKVVPSETLSTQGDEQISEVVRKIFQDSKGDIWFGSQSGAFRHHNDSLIRIEGIRDESGKEVTIKDIAEGIDGTIWIGHEGGVSSFDGESVKNYYESDGLLSYDVWNVETDGSGHVWIGTMEGLCKFDGHEFTVFDLPDGEVDTTLAISSTTMVHRVVEDSKGEIWFCTNAGLYKLVDDQLINVSKEVGIETTFVNEIVESKNGVFWISTKEALYRLADNRIESITEEIPEIGKGVGSVEVDSNGHIWFVVNQHDLYRYDGENLIEFEKSDGNRGPVVFEIFRDQDDRLWFVGYGGAYRLEEGRFVNVTKGGRGSRVARADQYA